MYKEHLLPYYKEVRVLMIKVRGQDGSVVVVAGPGPSSATVLGRERGFRTRDRTVSRNHLVLKFDPRRPDSLSFEVTGRNPLWVLSRRRGLVTVHRSSDTGWVGVGDGFCFSGNEPFWFFLEEGTHAAQVCTAGGAVDMGRDSDVEESLEVDVSAIDPVKEFGFLVVGHEFDSYPKLVLRAVNDWDWFLEEPSGEWDDGRDESDEVRVKSRRKRKKAKDDAMEEDREWMGESEEDEEALRKASKAKKGVYMTRSRDPLKPTKKARDRGGSSSVHNGKADHVEVEDEEDEEDDDETLGGFIVVDDDAEPEAENDDHDDDEEEFIDDEDE